MFSESVSDGKKLEPPACPKCGKGLVNHASRNETHGDRPPELVRVYLCYTHGFFTFRASEGLRHGL